MKRKDFFMGCLGLMVFSVLFFFFFGNLLMVILLPIWFAYYLGWGKKHV